MSSNDELNFVSFLIGKLMVHFYLILTFPFFHLSPSKYENAEHKIAKCQTPEHKLFLFLKSYF